MINLLPPESSKQLRAARHNNILLRYVIGSGIVLGLIFFVYASAFILLKSTELSNAAASEENQQKIARYKSVEASAKAYTSNLKIAKSIFDNETSYTTALHKIASALPSGVVLQSLELSPSTAGKPITLSVSAKTKASALSVKDSLEKAKVASGITIANFTEGSSAADGSSGDAQASANSEYPVSLSLNATFDKTIFKPEQKDE